MIYNLNIFTIKSILFIIIARKYESFYFSCLFSIIKRLSYSQFFIFYVFLMRKKKSFTIIEILITMIIMGTLSSALIPRIWDAKEETKQTMTKVDESRKLASEVGFDGYTFSSDSAWGGAQNLGDWVHHIWTDITVCREWNCITMQDRNLWAAKAGTTCSSADTWACGDHFQWWNNHWFLPGKKYSYAFPWWESTWATQVTNCANYWPTLGRYDSSTFIILDKFDWCKPRNDNLRWWANDSQENNRWYPVTNPTDRQWPCGEWYHVPSQWERLTLLKYWAANYTWAWNTLNLSYSNLSGLPYFLSNATAAGQFQKDFKIPFAGNRDKDAKVYEIGDSANFWSSSSYYASPGREFARYFFLYPNEASARTSSYRAYAYSVRCFKN